MNSASGFQADYFQQLAHCEEGNFWFEGRNALIGWVFKKYSVVASNIIEVGCGTGFVLRYLNKLFPGANFYGVDLFFEGLTFARSRNPQVNFIQADIKTIPFSSVFSVLGAFDVIEHVREDAVVLNEFYRVLKTGGFLLLTVPQHPCLWSDFDRRSYHQRRYTRKELTVKVTRAGFEVLETVSFVSLLSSLILLRKLLFFGRMNSDAIRSKGRANAFFTWIMFFEKVLIQSGIRFPFGGSLLLIARKR